MKESNETVSTLMKFIESREKEYKETLKSFQNEHGKYFIMEEKDAVVISCYEEFLKDLTELKKLILK